MAGDQARKKTRSSATAVTVAPPPPPPKTKANAKASAADPSPPTAPPVLAGDDATAKTRKPRPKVENPAGFQPSQTMYANIRKSLGFKSDPEAVAWFKSLSVLEKERAEDLYDSQTAINRLKASYRSALQVPERYGEAGTSSEGKIWAKEVEGLTRREIYKVFREHIKELKRLKKSEVGQSSTEKDRASGTMGGAAPPRKRGRPTNGETAAKRSAEADQRVRDRRIVEGVKGAKGLRTLVDSKLKKIYRDIRSLAHIVGKKEGCEMEMTGVVRITGLPYHQSVLEQQNGGIRLQVPEKGVVYSVFDEKSGPLPPERQELSTYTPSAAKSRQDFIVGQVNSALSEYLEFAEIDDKRDKSKVYSAIQAALEADVAKKKHPRPGPRPKRKFDESS